MFQRQIRLLIYAISALFLSLSTSTVTTAQDSAHPASNLPIPRSHLTDAELSRVVQIGTSGLSLVTDPSVLREKSSGEMTVLSSVEIVDDNKPGSLLAIVTTYNYNRNETTRRLVDLVQNKVVDKQTTKGDGAPLAKVEKKAVEALVLDDPRIIKLLGPDINDVEVETLLTRTQNSEDQFYGKRVVVALLKTSRGYPQYLPKIFVNLTDSKVVILE